MTVPERPQDDFPRLWKRARRLEDGAWDELWRRLAPRLRRWCARKYGREADDAVQGAFAAAIRELRKIDCSLDFQAENQLFGYLALCARTARREASPRVPLVLVPEEALPDRLHDDDTASAFGLLRLVLSDAGSDLVSGDADWSEEEFWQQVDHALHGREDEILAKLDSAIGRLGGRQRAVLLAELEGKSTAETAEVLGTTQGNVRVLRHRAIAALRTLTSETTKGEGDG